MISILCLIALLALAAAAENQSESAREGGESCMVLTVLVPGDTVACYSCTGTPPKYIKFNDASLMQYLKLKKLKAPLLTAGCREGDINDPKRSREVPKYTCESGVCVKLKGMFHGKIYPRV